MTFASTEGSSPTSNAAIMRDLESQVMIRAASLTEDDTPAIATFLEDVKVGARLK